MKTVIKPWTYPIQSNERKDQIDHLQINGSTIFLFDPFWCMKDQPSSDGCIMDQLSIWEN